MKRALTAIAVLMLAGTGVLVSASPALAAQLAVCVISEEEVTIDTANNTAELEYELYCPILVGYDAPGTAYCTGEGTGDQANPILAWTNTEDVCTFADSGGYIGLYVTNATREFALVPLTGLAAEVGAGIAVEGIYVPSVLASVASGQYVTADTIITFGIASVPAPSVTISGA